MVGSCTVLPILTNALPNFTVVMNYSFIYTECHYVSVL